MIDNLLFKIILEIYIFIQTLFHGYYSSAYDKFNPLINDSFTVKKQFSKSSELIQKTGLVSNSFDMEHPVVPNLFGRIFILFKGIFCK